MFSSSRKLYITTEDFYIPFDVFLSAIPVSSQVLEEYDEYGALEL